MRQFPRKSKKSQGLLANPQSIENHPNHLCLAFFGYFKKGDSRALNGETVFEVGSVAKVVTSLLLSEMVQNGQHALSDRVAKYLPETVKLPDKDGRLTFVTGEQGRAREGIVREAGSKCTRRGLSERGPVLGGIFRQIRH